MFDPRLYNKLTAKIVFPFFFFLLLGAEGREEWFPSPASTVITKKISHSEKGQSQSNSKTDPCLRTAEQCSLSGSGLLLFVFYVKGLSLRDGRIQDLKEGLKETEGGYQVSSTDLLLHLEVRTISAVDKLTPSLP